MILDRSFMKCCGHDQLWQGKVDVFERMRDYNTKIIKMLGVKTFITSCAEGYRTFKLDYKLDGVREENPGRVPGSVPVRSADADRTRLRGAAGTDQAGRQRRARRAQDVPRGRAVLRRRADDVLQRQDEGPDAEAYGRSRRRGRRLLAHRVPEVPDAFRVPAPRKQVEAGRGTVPVQGDGHHPVPRGTPPGRVSDGEQHRREAEGATDARPQRVIGIATPAKPAPTPAAPATPSDPLVTYYRSVRQMNIQLAKDRYKQGFRVRTQG